MASHINMAVRFSQLVNRGPCMRSQQPHSLFFQLNVTKDWFGGDCKKKKMAPVRSCPLYCSTFRLSGDFDNSVKRVSGFIFAAWIYYKNKEIVFLAVRPSGPFCSIFVSGDFVAII